MGEIIAVIARILAILIVGVFVFCMILLAKKVAISPRRLFYRILIVIATTFILAVTLLPRYYIFPSKIDISSFGEVVDFAERNKLEDYAFQTKNYSGYFVVEDISHLEEYKNLIYDFTKGKMVIEGKENNIKHMCAPVIATREVSTLGCRSDVESKILLWDDKNVVYISYWYEAKGFIVHVFTFPELFYKDSISLDKILTNVLT